MKLLRSLSLLILLVYIAATSKSGPYDAIIWIVVALMMIAAYFAIRRRAQKPFVPSLSLAEHQIEDAKPPEAERHGGRTRKAAKAPQQ